MAKLPLTKQEQKDLDAEIEAQYVLEAEETGNYPAKLSEQIIAGLDDDEMAMTVLRRVKGRKTAFLFELDEFDDMGELSGRLRDEYGGGSFIIQGRRGNGQLAFNQGLDIERPIKKDEPEPQQSGGNFESILLAMNQNSERQSNETRDLMIQMNNKSAEASRDNMNMLVKMMEINKPQPQQQMSAMDIVALMTSVKEMTAQPVQDNPMELFIKGMEMGKETSSGGDESILQTAIKSFGGPLANLAQLQTGTTPANPPQIAAPVHATPQTSNVGMGRDTPALPNNDGVQPEQPKETPEMLAQFALLQKWTPTINTLLRAASLNAEPEIYANYLLDQIPLEDIEAFLNDDDTYNKFFELVQQAQPFRNWFDDCRALVLQYLKEGELPEQTPANVPESEQSKPEDIPGEVAPAIDGDTGDTASTDT